MQPRTTGWPKRIRVDKRIVNLLSRSLYADFPRAIREMVSNSYDADATIVRIKVELKNKEIVVEDNGNGMSAEQFDNYLRIAGQPSEGSEGGELSPKFQRRRIGRFGVGFLAAFPFCQSLEITSKRQGVETGFIAVIPAERYVRGVGTEEEVSSIPVDGYNEPRSGKIHEHYTRIRMIGLNDLAIAYFSKRSERRKYSIEAQRGMDKLKWQLCETLPLDFKNKNSELAVCLEKSPAGMEIWLNDEQLFRNDLGGQVIDSTGPTYVKLGNLEFEYAITTNWHIIQPVEARGLKIRLHGVGIGPRTYLDVEKEVRTFSRLNWLTGEIHVLKGLDESLALSRDTFTWSPDYQALKERFHKVLTRNALWVERVASTEKTLLEAFEKKDVLPPISTAELINQSVKRLVGAGFKVLKKSRKEVKGDQYPVSIDKRNKVVTVIDDHPSVSYLIEMPQKKLRIRYKAFEKGDKKEEPVQLSEDGVIEVNTLYPIFGGRTKGDIMRRLHILLFLAKQECKTAEEMYSYLIERIKEEFR